jgi:hypothetical protein
VQLKNKQLVTVSDLGPAFAGQTTTTTGTTTADCKVATTCAACNPAVDVSVCTVCATGYYYNPATGSCPLCADGYGQVSQHRGPDDT